VGSRVGGLGSRVWGLQGLGHDLGLLGLEGAAPPPLQRSIAALTAARVSRSLPCLRHARIRCHRQSPSPVYRKKQHHASFVFRQSGRFRNARTGYSGLLPAGTLGRKVARRAKSFRPCDAAHSSSSSAGRTGMRLEHQPCSGSTHPPQLMHRWPGAATLREASAPRRTADSRHQPKQRGEWSG